MKQKNLSHHSSLISGHIAIFLIILAPTLCETAVAEKESNVAISPRAAEPLPTTLEISSMRHLIANQQSQLERQKEQIDSQSALLKKLLRQVSEIQSSLSTDQTPATFAGRLAAEDPTATGTASSKATLGATAPTPAAAKSTPSLLQKPAKSTFKAYWKQGLRFDTSDKIFQLKVGGSIMNDWGVFAPSKQVASGIGPLENGTEFRRARLYVEGVLHKHIKFKSQYDFGGGKAGLKDMYIGLTKLPGVGNIMFGHMKEPFGLEGLTSSKYITFLERSLSSTFAPGRNTGVMLKNAVLGNKFTWAVGTFRDADSFGKSFGNGGYNYTGRVTARPLYQEKGRKIMHLGLAYRHGNPNGNSLRYRARPSAHLLPRFVDTKSFSATSTETLGAEFAVVSGPGSIQSEFTYSSANLSPATRGTFTAFYVQGSLFLTGEHRVYKSSAGAFDRVKPNRSFMPGDGNGRGAWELAVRYAQINLNDGPIQGGELQDFTLGLNWYLNPNTRFMWNYGWAERVDLGGANLLQTRFQVDF